MFEQLSGNQLYILIRALNTERNLVEGTRTETFTFKDQLEDIRIMYEAAQKESIRRVSGK